MPLIDVVTSLEAADATSAGIHINVLVPGMRPEYTASCVRTAELRGIIETASKASAEVVV